MVENKTRTFQGRQSTRNLEIETTKDLLPDKQCPENRGTCWSPSHVSKCELKGKWGPQVPHPAGFKNRYLYKVLCQNLRPLAFGDQGKVDGCSLTQTGSFLCVEAMNVASSYGRAGT